MLLLCTTMPLDKSNPVLHIEQLEAALRIARYPTDTAVPPEIFTRPDSFVSITRTSDELSIVGSHDAIAALPHSDHTGGPYVALKVRGPLAFDMVGIMAHLTAPLKAAAISIFVISTWCARNHPRLTPGTPTICSYTGTASQRLYEYCARTGGMCHNVHGRNKAASQSYSKHGAPDVLVSPPPSPNRPPVDRLSSCPLYRPQWPNQPSELLCTRQIGVKIRIVKVVWEQRTSGRVLKSAMPLVVLTLPCLWTLPNIALASRAEEHQNSHWASLPCVRRLG